MTISINLFWCGLTTQIVIEFKIISFVSINMLPYTIAQSNQTSRKSQNKNKSKKGGNKNKEKEKQNYSDSDGIQKCK